MQYATGNPPGPVMSPSADRASLKRLDPYFYSKQLSHWNLGIDQFVFEKIKSQS